MIIIVMGVSGVGKTAVGSRLAHELGWTFVEADDHHPSTNVAKMSRGEPLTDLDRAPWLTALRAEIERCRAEERSAVVTCSALKRAYRDVLRKSDEHDIVFVHLTGDPDLIRTRMSHREHFMQPSMLESQFATLEAASSDERIITFGISSSIDAIVAQIRALFCL